MRIIESSFQLWMNSSHLTPAIGQDLLQWIEYNARISHRSEDKQTSDSWQRFIQSVVVDKGDWSVAEHASVTAILRVDRGVTHELVRHRHFSYTQESTRFVNYAKKGEDLEFIRPMEIEVGSRAEWAWNTAIRGAEDEYLEMIGLGIRPQAARSVLPNALAATISMTGNLRSWRQFFMARTTKETHPDFRRISIPMLAEFQRCIPILYADLVPEEKQSISMAKVR